MMKKTKIIFVVSQPMSVVVFLLPHLRRLKPFYNLSLITDNYDLSKLQKIDLNLEIYGTKIERKIRPLSDFLTLLVLIIKFLKEKPFAVHTITPKSGLLGIFSAWLTRVPVRVHTFTGQVWMTRKGIMRWLLRFADKCIAYMATDILVDSPSQRSFLIEEGVLKLENSAVLGAGSICGVNTKRFCPNQIARNEVREEMGCVNDTLVCLFLGRLNFDKGVLDLASAFAQIASRHPNVELWFVGPDEESMFSKIQTLVGIYLSRVRFVGYTNEPERYMQAADLFCLPSYREGFGSSVIEAAACGVPSLTSRIYGLTDAVVEGKTGWMHEAGNIQDLTTNLDQICQNPKEILIRGKAAKDYAESVFEQNLITEAMLDFYQTKFSKVNI